MSEQVKIRAFLEAKNLKFRETESHYQLNCFLCTDTQERLGISKETGQWGCLKGSCGCHGGKLSTLKYAFDNKGDIKRKHEDNPDKEKKCTIKPNMHRHFIKELANDEDKTVLKYLCNERKFSIDAIKHFQLGHRWEFFSQKSGAYDAGDHLAIPYILGGKCVNLKYRALDPNVDKKYKWLRETGGISSLFNDAVLDNLDYDEICIAESELDAISLWDIGLKNTVGLTVGAKGFKTEWYDRLKRFKKIYLILDNDKVGQEGARALAQRLGLGRCYNVVLPEEIKDPNDFLQQGKSPKVFSHYLEKAERFSLNKVKTVSRLMEDLYDKLFGGDAPVVETNYETPWKKVNKTIGPLRQGFLFILAGKPKSGKTTLALNLMKAWGDQGIKSAIYSCEMRDERLRDKWLFMDQPVMRKIEELTKLQWVRTMLRMPMGQMLTFYPETAEDLEIEGVVNNAEAIVQRHGIEVLVIDNLHYLCRGENENALVSVATQQFKLMAERNDIMVILVTHPRKTNNNKQLKTDDMKGSGTIFQDADVVWLMHRRANDGDTLPDDDQGNNDAALSQLAEINITGRWTDGGNAVLAFEGARSLFFDRGPLFNRLMKEYGSKSKKKKGKGF